METVVAHVQPSNSNSKKSNVGASTSAVPAAAEAPGSENEAVASAVTTDSSPTKLNPATTASSPGVSVNNNSNSSSNNNPIFVITNSSSAGGYPGNSNNLEMPSNSHPVSTSACGGEPVISSSVSAGGSSGGAHSEDDDGGGALSGAQGAAASTMVSSVVSTAVSSGQQQRHSNPRQSTLTRSHAITLDEDSDCASPQCPDSVGGNQSLPQEQEQELIHFIIDTCNRNVKDKNFILRIEADLTQFVKDESRQTLPFPQMTSYQRMLVHRMATLFDLDHNVDNSSGGNFVVVSKDLNGRGHGGRIPPIRFKELPAMIVSTTSTSSPLLTSIDPNASAEAILIDPATGNTLSTAPSTTSTTSSKKILKREKIPSLGSDKKGASGGPAKTKSLEERTQDYHKARRRIFEDNSGESGSGISLDNSVSTSSKKLNWSSTDSSEDRMYLKPPFPGNTSGGKLIKVESFESASQKKPSNRDTRAMGKSHSFGGYEENNPIQTTGGHVRVPVGGGKIFQGGANNNSNNASSSMISCSSSSSLRSSSFSKQDSSSSTTSGSGQSPSGGTSSGYKSGSSSGGIGVVPGYYSTGGGNGVNGANNSGLMGTVTPQGHMALHSAGDPMKPPPAIVFAPAGSGANPQQQMIQTDDMSAGSPNSSQQVVFCCWAVADVNNVPPGALIIDPSTGQAVKNSDGTQYFYDPSNPPKFVQTVPAPTAASIPQPPPPSTPQQQEMYSTMYPPVLAGPSITGFAPMQPSGAGGNPPQPTSFMAIPSGATASGPAPQVYFPGQTPVSTSNTSSGSTQDIQDISGYFSQLNVAGNSGGRPAQPSVIYVPVDALSNTATYATALSSDQQTQGAAGTYFEDPSQTQAPAQQVPSSSVPIQFPAPGAGGYVLQQVVDPNGSSTPGVYYYGGNLIQAPPAVQCSTGNSGVQQAHGIVSHQQQPRFKNWIMPQSHPSQHQHPTSQGYSFHGTPPQVPGGTPTAQQQNNPPAQGPPPGAIMIHPNNVPQNSMLAGGPGLVSIPTVLPPHPAALSGVQQQPSTQQLSSQSSQQNSTLVPLSYHPTQALPPQPGAGVGGNAQTLMQTLVPCVQSYPSPHPPATQHQPQSFASPQQHHQSHQQHHSSHHHTHHSTRPHHHQNHPHGGPQQHHHHPHNQGQPRFLAVTGTSAAAAAAAAAASQQQQQQQILFAAAAAMNAMAINNYTGFATGATPTSNTARFMKGTGRGGGGGVGVHHGAVTGVVRRGKSYPANKQQQQNSSKQ